MRSLKLFILSLLVFLVSCQQEKEKITLYYSINQPMGEIAFTIRNILEDELNIEVETVIGEGTLADLAHLKNGEGQLALVDNHIGFQKGIQSLMPVYPQILHVFYKSDIEGNTLNDIVRGKKVFLGHKGDGSRLFAESILDFFKIDHSSFEMSENPFASDVLLGFTDIILDEDLEGLTSYHLFSFDPIEKYGKGSNVEAIALKFPKVKPFIIPQNTYFGFTNEPVLTLASDVILVGSETLPDELAYDITKTIFRNLQEFNHISPLISQDLKEDFSRSDLSFPLHNGSRIYLDRDEPTFFERYAELFGVVFSMVIALLSGLYSFSKWFNQRKKDRIDVFYQELMNIKSTLEGVKTPNILIRQLRRIKAEQEKAFDMLVEEKLAANESFRIYMELSKETVSEVKARLNKLRIQAKGYNGHIKIGGMEKTV